MPPLEEALSALLERLDAREIPYMVVGGVALEGLGVPRATLDIDVQIRVGEPPAVSDAYFLGLFVEEHSRDDVFDQPAVILMDPRTGVPFELFITDHWFTEQAFDRQRDLHSDLLDREVPLPTPEDFILLKACYWQDAGRPRAKANQDELDLEGVISAHQGGLDLTYLEENGRRLDVWDPLSQKLDAER